MKKLTLALSLMAAALSFTAQADEIKERIQQQLQKADARIPVQSIDPAPLAGFYEVTLATGEVLYAHEQGEHFFVGALYAIDADKGLVNLTDLAQNRLRQQALAQVPAEQMITYPARGERKARLVIYTDVDCPYCRRIHQEIPELNSMGVEVSYLAFPRGGANTATYNTMVSVWCADTAAERNRLMDRVNDGKSIPEKRCDNPVLDQLQLGRQMGVTGTPAMLLEDGSLIPGYMPAARIGQLLGLN